MGISIGTRPDCVDEEKLSLIQKYTDNYDVWIEYGLRSIRDKHKTINETIPIALSQSCGDDKKQRYKNMRSCYYWPAEETERDMIETAKVRKNKIRRDKDSSSVYC